MIKITPLYNKKIAFRENENKAPKAPATTNVIQKAPSAPSTAETSLTSAFLAQLPNVQLPQKGRNHCVFDETKVNGYVKQGEKALPELKQVLHGSKDEKQIVETLYILDRMIDSGVKGIDKMYPVLSKFNDTDSPNIQVFLAGIYRKTQVPDAFGPLVKMLIKDSKMTQVQKDENKTNCPNCEAFDPTEEIGGAILEYIRNYSNMPNKPKQQ